MIRHQDIKNLEVEWGLRESVIEKDYVIGWMLWGIGTHPVLRDAWVFKGGTCLKKCYFETYRFSEDLDFTVLPGSQFKPDDVFPMLDDIVARITEESGIDFTIKQRKMKVRPGGLSSEGRIYYRGPRMARSAALVKLDLNSAEKVVRPPVMRTVSHPFRDELPLPSDISCYSFEELFAEKIRALGERCRPRDLYDVINLYRHSDLRQAPSLIRGVLEQKCRSKGVPVPSFEQIENSPALIELKSEWSNMLAHQLPNLPPHDLYWNELRDFFDWLEEKVVHKPLPAVPVAAGEDTAWAPPPTVYVWGQQIPLELIRFAGANYLCVEIDYQKADGTRTQRLIEPYSLRRTTDHHIILHAYDRDQGDHRSFSVDRLRGVQVTSTPFTPRYVVEFTQTGTISTPPTQRKSTTS